MRLIDADALEDMLRRSSFWDWSIKEDKTAHEWVEQIISNMDIIEVAFLCDREKCEQCNNDDCQHTKDIIHAISFDKIDNTKYIEKTPTIDAVKVVRCKDCYYFTSGKYCGLNSGEMTNEDDYCSYGERKE